MNTVKDPERHILNAIITSAKIEIDERGFLTVWLDFDYGNNMTQRFGGYTLYHSKHGEIGHDGGGYFIYSILQICDVKKWDDLVGKTIRVDAIFTEVFGIGHIVKDEWFYPNEITVIVKEKKTVLML